MVVVRLWSELLSEGFCMSGCCYSGCCHSGCCQSGCCQSSRSQSGYCQSGYCQSGCCQSGCCQNRSQAGSQSKYETKWLHLTVLVINKALNLPYWPNCEITQKRHQTQYSTPSNPNTTRYPCELNRKRKTTDPKPKYWSKLWTQRRDPKPKNQPRRKNSTYPEVECIERSQLNQCPWHHYSNLPQQTGISVGKSFQLCQIIVEQHQK